MQHPILYSYRRCPFAMRARIALWISGIQCEVREISLKDKPALFLTTSPKGTVPVLVLPDGRIIDESLDIMLWALKRHDPYQWLDEGLMLGIDQAMQTFVPCVYRFKYPDRYEAEEVARLIQQGWDWLKVHEAVFVGGDEVSKAQLNLFKVALFPFLRQWFFVAKQQGIEQLSELQKWVEMVEALPCYQAIMTDYPRWVSEDNAPVWLLPS